MRIATIIIGFTFSIMSLVTLAGAGHDHSHSHDPVNQSQAEVSAIKFVTNLVDNGKIDKSWKSTKVKKSEKKKFGDELEWVIVFNNRNISDPTQQKLYIFLTLSGEYIGANYTGK